MLFHLAVQLLPYPGIVNTMSGCCGGSSLVSNIVREDVKQFLNEQQIEALEDKIIEHGKVVSTSPKQSSV